MTTALSRLVLLTLAFTPLGCPLLLEDDFVLVDAETVATGGAPDDMPATGGAPEGPPCPVMCDSCAGGAPLRASKMPGKTCL
jgi:hypothetical protein